MVVTKPSPNARQGKRRPPNTNMWKKDEAWWAKYIGDNELGATHRQPSQGVAAPDIWRRKRNVDGSYTPTLVAEHKTTHALPAFMIKAISQEKVNRETYPGIPSYIFITFHNSASRKVYRFVMKPVHDGDEWSDDIADIKEAA